MLIKENQEFVRQPSKHVLSEYVVPLDCDFINQEIHNIPFPKNAIVVSIIRDGSYIIARDDLKIKYGDQIHFLTDVNDYPYVHEEIEFLINKD